MKDHKVLHTTYTSSCSQPGCDPLLIYSALMAHDIFDVSDDPYHDRLSELALAFPEPQMRVSHGAPLFLTKRVLPTA